MMKYILPMLSLFVSLSGNAVVYENVSKQSDITYSDMPTAGSKPAVIPEPNIISSFTPDEPLKITPASNAIQVKSGTGFFVSKMYIVTNAHVIDGCDKVIVKGAVPQHEVSVEFVDAQHDLALLKSDTPPLQSAPLRTNLDNLKVGDPVYFIGYPGKNGIFGDYSFVKTQIVNLGDGVTNNHDWFYITNVVEHGDSGGPVLDQDGNVIGVVAATGALDMINRKSQQTVSSIKVGMVITLKTLKDFLLNDGIFSTWSPTSLFHDDAYLEENAKNYIVNIQCRIK